MRGFGDARARAGRAADRMFLKDMVLRVVSMMALRVLVKLMVLDDGRERVLTFHSLFSIVLLCAFIAAPLQFFLSPHSGAAPWKFGSGVSQDVEVGDLQAE